MSISNVLFGFHENQMFFFSESSVRLKRQQNSHLGNRLDIKPSGPHHKPVGKNLFFTCKAEVSNPSLVRDLKWLKPNGQNIPEDDRYLTFLHNFADGQSTLAVVCKEKFS